MYEIQEKVNLVDSLQDYAKTCGFPSTLVSRVTKLNVALAAEEEHHQEASEFPVEDLNPFQDASERAQDGGHGISAPDPLACLLLFLCIVAFVPVIFSRTLCLRPNN